MIKVPTKNFANSSFAIIEIGDSFLLQKRDDIKNIWYPSMLGLFGGKIENNENEFDALKREILEETNIILKKISFLCDFRIKNKKSFFTRYIFFSKIKNLPNNFHVTEGKGYVLVKKDKLFSLKKTIIPTDYVSLSYYLRLKYSCYLL